MMPRHLAMAFGILFGFVLGWARVTEYDVIHNMLLFKEFHVYLIMASAIVTAGVGVRVLRLTGAHALTDGTPICWKTAPPQRRHVVGSVLFGLGWSLACTCPGPLAAQIGRGQLVALFTVAGVLSGIWLHESLTEASRRAAAARDAEAAVATEPARATAGL